MEVTEKIVGFIPQIDENVKTLFENYLKKPRNLSLAENSAFVNPFSEEISIYFEAENEAEARKSLMIFSIWQKQNSTFQEFSA